jgi:hypothetical protein
MLSYATTTSNKNSLLGTDRARQGKKQQKRDDYRHGANRSGRLEQSKRGQAYDGKRKKIRIKSDEGIYATCSLQVLHTRKQNHAMERKLETSFTRNGRKWRVGQDMVVVKTARRTF